MKQFLLTFIGLILGVVGVTVILSSMFYSNGFYVLVGIFCLIALAFVAEEIKEVDNARNMDI